MTFKEFIDAIVRLSDEHTEAVERLNKKLEELLSDMKEQNKLAEPLIKDEKIRKAVRAWAEVNGVDEVAYVSRSNSFGRFGNSIMFDNNLDLHGLEDVRFYTIAELCGEEEE